MIYAIIENDIVVNLIWLSSENAKEFPAAVPTDDLPVFIGDTYTDGKFYRDNAEVIPYEIQEELITEYGISQNLYNAIIDDYTLELIESGVIE